MKIALLGFGTVGSGFYEIFKKRKKEILNRYGCDADIVKILVRNRENYINIVPNHILTTSFEDVMEEKPDVIIEVMGGIHPTKVYIELALKNRISVITANKDLMAEYGKSLLQYAHQQNVHLKFEASVGGGMPCIDVLFNQLFGQDVTEVTSIINGTSNFILSKMYDDDAHYDDVLKLAQDLGFAESKPDADVEGIDALRKLVILSSLAFDKYIKLDDFKCEGITNIQPEDLAYAKQHRSKIKLIAKSYIDNNYVYGAVMPMYVSDESMFYKIDNEVNAINYYTEDFGDLFLNGKGAGKIPTGNSIFNDLLNIIKTKYATTSCDWSTRYRLLETNEKADAWVIKFETHQHDDIQKHLLELFIDNSIKIDHFSEDFLYADIVHHSESTLSKLLEEIPVDLYHSMKVYPKLRK